MRLHSYAASANCLKVRLLLRLLDIDCEIVDVDTVPREIGWVRSRRTPRPRR